MPGQNLLFWEQVLTAQSALNTTGVPTKKHLVPQTREIVAYVAFSAGVDAGVVMLEGAHDASYAGTWATLATISWAAASRVHRAAVTGAHLAIRLRISTGVTNGTVDGYLVGT